MYNTSFIKKILLAVTVVLLYSCDKDFNAIGDNLIGDDHFGLESEKYDVVAYNQEVTPIQSNALPINALGIFDNPLFGSTTANYNTQVTLAAYPPTLGEITEIESVVLNIPYFSHATAADEKGGNVYALDSIFGAPNGKLKLSVYESGYQMRSSYFENGNQVAQLYYTDQNTVFSGNKIGALLNDDVNEAQNKRFFFDAAQKKDSTLAEGSTTKYNVTYSVPEMRLNLNKTFFLDKILKASASKLATQEVFQEYFRGLYFQVEKTDSNDPTNMAMINFAQGKITIKYKAKTDSTTDGDSVESRSVILNLTGNTANLLDETKAPEYTTAITNVNSTTGDDRLYLKGGQGSLAVLNIFGTTDLIGYDTEGNVVNGPNGVPDQLDEIRQNVVNKKWLANEANLVFYIDSEKMTGTKEPKRIYLYDLDNNIPIIDYAADGSSTITNDPKMGKVIYSGIINVDATSKRGNYYKFRLTNHIRNIIKDKTVKNVRLGLVITDDISVVASNKLKLKNNVISEAPRASVISPLGTILYGGTSTVPDDRRLKLEIYYTKPN